MSTGADGTLTWQGHHRGDRRDLRRRATRLGWTYSTAAAAHRVSGHLIPAINGRDAFDITGCWEVTHRACRNLGTKGLVMQASAPWTLPCGDLKVRLPDVPVSGLLGQFQDTVSLPLGDRDP